jgi:alpha-1,6-mannosyltransferase
VSRRRFLGLLGCGLVLIGLTVSGLYAQGEDDRGWFVAIALTQAAVYLGALGLIVPVPAARRSLALILGVAVALRIVALLAPPFLSSDVYRYVWDGRVLAAGINPYRYIPTDPQLASLRDGEIFPEINRGNYAPTIYPPAAQAIFFAATRFSESITAMKAAMVVFEAVAVALMLSLLAGAGLPASRIIIYAWHPLLLWEFAGNGHIDAAIVAFVALALWSRRPAPLTLSYRPMGPASGRPEDKLRPVSAEMDPGFRRDDKARGSSWLTGLALAAATLVKFYPIVLFPALWRRWDWRMPAVFTAALVLAYLPFLGVGWGVFGFLPGYLAEEGFSSGGGFYLWSLARTVLPPGAVPDFVYLVVVACSLGGLAVYVAWMRPGPDGDVCGDVFGAALLAGAFVVLLSPHYPWYFAWLIVFACLVPSVSLLWLTLASFLLYLVPVGSQLVRDRHRFLVETAVYVPFLALAALDLWRHRRPAKEQLKHGGHRD